MAAKIRLLFVGREGDDEFASAVERYVSRARRFVPTEVVFVREEKPGGKPEAEKILAAEARRIKAALRDRDFLVLCDAGGKERSSPEFAGDLKRWVDGTSGSVVFAVGGAFGLDADLKREARAILPLSRMTLPHQLARVVLAEQVYRAIASLSGVAYSK